jgi:signal transduction histidine kinase
LKSGENLTHEQTKAVVRLRHSVDRMTKIIVDILDFTRTRLGGSLPISLDDTDLEDTLRLVIDELRSYHPRRELKIRVSGDLRGTWDRTRIEQIASNLISNALQYSPLDSAVTVVARDEGEVVSFSVHNAGEPIPREGWRVLFDPLVRGGPEARDRRSKQDGLGLGLYIAKEIAEAHGGRIELDSSQDAGTTFKVTLPRHPVPLRPQ